MRQERELVDSDLWSARVLASELRLPLTVAAHSIQLARIAGDISLVGDAEKALLHGMDIVEEFVATSTLLADQLMLELEPYTVGAVLEDVAHKIEPMAKTYGVDLIIHAPRTKQPATLHRIWTVALLSNIAAVFVHMPLRSLTLGAHRTDRGARAGVFADGVSAAEVLRQARVLVGSSNQPVRSSSAGAANLIIADRIGKALSLPISSSIHGGQSGIAVSLPWSRQLSLV